jgi:hypothetical protein
MAHVYIRTGSDAFPCLETTFLGIAQGAAALRDSRGLSVEKYSPVSGSSESSLPDVYRDLVVRSVDNQLISHSRNERFTFS